MIRVVFDTNVFVRSLINPYGIWGRLVFQRADRYQLIVSEAIIREILEVLNRPEITRKYRSIATRDLRAILDFLAAAEAVEVVDTPALSCDPKDDKFLATADASNAEYLVSEDEDLLALKEYAGTKIVRATDFLAILEEREPSQ